jgi:hypothetical protein
MTAMTGFARVVGLVLKVFGALGMETERETGVELGSGRREQLTFSNVHCPVSQYTRHPLVVF